MNTLTVNEKNKIVCDAKAAADYMKNGIHRENSWVRVCLLYKGSLATPNKRGVGRLVDALSIYFYDVGFGSKDIGTHYEIACSDAGVSEKAREFIAGWLEK